MDSRVRVAIEQLALLRRPPGSEGEHAAAAAIARELRARHARVRIERERVQRCLLR
jgi:hypothetical protein